MRTAYPLRPGICGPPNQLPRLPTGNPGASANWGPSSGLSHNEERGKEPDLNVRGRFRIEYQVSHPTRCAVTSYWSQETGPDRLQELGRSHWSIENGQYHCRDRTQAEDQCPVRETTAARNLSLFRSLAIFLFKRQTHSKDAKKIVARL